jgi:hypothetical protein
MDGSGEFFTISGKCGSQISPASFLAISHRGTFENSDRCEISIWKGPNSSEAAGLVVWETGDRFPNFKLFRIGVNGSLRISHGLYSLLVGFLARVYRLYQQSVRPFFILRYIGFEINHSFEVVS